MLPVQAFAVPQPTSCNLWDRRPSPPSTLPFRWAALDSASFSLSFPCLTLLPSSFLTGATSLPASFFSLSFSCCCCCFPRPTASPFGPALAAAAAFEPPALDAPPAPPAPAPSLLRPRLREAAGRASSEPLAEEPDEEPDDDEEEAEEDEPEEDSDPDDSDPEESDEEELGAGEPARPLPAPAPRAAPAAPAAAAAARGGFLVSFEFLLFDGEAGFRLAAPPVRGLLALALMPRDVSSSSSSDEDPAPAPADPDSLVFPAARLLVPEKRQQIHTR